MTNLKFLFDVLFPGGFVGARSKGTAELGVEKVSPAIPLAPSPLVFVAPPLKTPTKPQATRAKTTLAENQ